MRNAADAPNALPTRFEQLRQRVLSLEVSAAGSLIPLDRRIARLSQRIHEADWRAADQHQRAVAPVSPCVANVPPEPIARVQHLMGRVAPLREQLSLLTNSDIFDELPVERSRLKQAEQIAALADSMMRQISSIEQQIQMLPAWESMVRQASDRYAELATLARRHQRRRHEVATLREIFCQLLAGGRPRWEAIVELAGRILHDLQEESQPELFRPSVGDAATSIASHAINVAQFVGYLASSLEALRPHRLGAVAAALLADVGMLKTSSSAFGQIRVLTDDERAALERHPLESAAMADRIPGFDPILARAIAQHHERLDGSGYPSAASGEEITPVGRLLACADVYVARRSRRAHREASDPSAALTGTLAEADSGQLDEAIARGLLNLSLYPVGTVVELATTEIAEVVATQNAQNNPTLAALPIVKILMDRQGNILPVPSYRNLATRSDSRIVRTVQAEELYFRRQSA